MLLGKCKLDREATTEMCLLDFKDYSTHEINCVPTAWTSQGTSLLIFYYHFASFPRRQTAWCFWHPSLPLRNCSEQRLVRQTHFSGLARVNLWVVLTVLQVPRRTVSSASVLAQLLVAPSLGFWLGFFPPLLVRKLFNWMGSWASPVLRRNNDQRTDCSL